MLRTHCNIVLTSTSRAFSWSLSFRLSHQNPVYASTHSMRATRPALLILDLVNRLIFDEEYRLWIFSLCTLLNSPVDPNIILSNLFSNIVRLFPSFSFRDQVSHPCKTSTNHCVMLCYIIMTISSVVKQTICLVLSQTFFIRVFVQFDTQNFSDAVSKANSAAAQYRCTVSCHLNHLAFLSRL